ncbi:MAG: aminodeoxychorismate/anthranilate synthase component II [Saprospiraceae bacterium]|nr:aminodeoxychorismate/anthranilate synthase component II [Saprospiraceae bacterium]
MKSNKVIIIDNYDSFTYNLLHIVEELLGEEVHVVRNDQFKMEDLEQYERIILSPGPGIPEEAGLLKDVITHYSGKKKIFGVCLGLQAIGEVFGASLRNLSSVLHGQRTIMHKTAVDSPILREIPDSFYAGRYHSWVIDKDSDTSNLLITAIDDEGEIMAARHKELPVYGVQFHPESIMTDEGKKMIHNFLTL